MIYKASWSNFTKIVTVSVTLLFLFILLIPTLAGSTAHKPGNYFIAILLIATYLICYGLRPVNYSITPEKLTIHRPWKDVIINRNQIANAELLDDEKLKWSVRIFASGGVFGFYGKFYNSKIGSMTWYATRAKNAVLVRTVEKKNIILTPDDASDFVAKIRALFIPAA